MAKTKITREVVWAAADELKSLGKNINAATIRKHLGNIGSNSTIQPYLDDWYVEEGKKSKQFTEMSEEVYQIVKTHASIIWDKFNLLVKEKIENEREDCAQKIKKASAEVNDTWQFVDFAEQSKNEAVSAKNLAESIAKKYEMELFEAKVNRPGFRGGCLV